MVYNCCCCRSTCESAVDEGAVDASEGNASDKTSKEPAVAVAVAVVVTGGQTRLSVSCTACWQQKMRKPHDVAHEKNEQSWLNERDRILSSSHASPDEKPSPPTAMTSPEGEAGPYRCCGNEGSSPEFCVACSETRSSRCC